MSNFKDVPVKPIWSLLDNLVNKLLKAGYHPDIEHNYPYENIVLYITSGDDSHLNIITIDLNSCSYSNFSKISDYESNDDLPSEIKEYLYEFCISCISLKIRGN
ncbi:hypothetical protein [Apilactobacillus xinyiensis]|uniref:hypothetical protein n=1 Tax=Apilactobacillus xinyiensis TaxID=2841032 RepID=UPI002010BC96|nr:hypothetical protein [Apilactobacillus xinyiensis]MCL0330645.1 hypothetical protein [Apilactobacillus xinyiensis]